MPVLKPVRLVLVVLAALIAIPAATVHAAQRMPIGFFDDPSFRWSPTREQNLQLAASAGASVIHTTATWAAIAPTKPADPANGDDPAYQLTDLDDLVFHVGPARPARDDQRHRHAEVGERRQDAELHADAAVGSDDVHEDARDAVQRPHRPRLGRALVGLERAEPRSCSSTPQFSGRRSSARRTTPSSTRRRTRASRRATRSRRSRSARRRPADATSRSGRQRRASRRARSRSCSRKVSGLKFDAWAHHPYPTSPNLPPLQKVRYPNVTLSTLPLFEKRSEDVVPSDGADLDHRVRPRDEAGRAEGRHDCEAVGVRQAGADDREERSERPDVRLVRLPRQSTGNPWQSGLESRSGAHQAGVRRLQRDRSADGRPDDHGEGGRARRVTIYVPYLGSLLGRPGTRSASRTSVQSTGEGGRRRIADSAPLAPTSPCHVHAGVHAGEGPHVHGDDGRERGQRAQRSPAHATSSRFRSRRSRLGPSRRPAGRGWGRRRARADGRNRSRTSSRAPRRCAPAVCRGRGAGTRPTRRRRGRRATRRCRRPTSAARGTRLERRRPCTPRSACASA